MKQEVIIGKYTLESLTNGMYASPLDLYREYIQNAVDSIDFSISEKLEKKDVFRIDIAVNKSEKCILIRDNGMGVPQEFAAKTLVDIGNSNKKREESRGFRGIGRLAGLGYCKKLIFSTSYSGEGTKTVVSFDAEKLNKLLLARDSEDKSATEVMEQVITVKQEIEKTKEHYFKVMMVEVTENDKLLDIELVRDYIVQHAPLKYNDQFKWQDPIIEKSEGLGFVIHSYNIFLNGEKLYKPYRDKFESDRIKKNIDTIKDIEVIPFYRDGKISAILWCAITNYFGTITENSIKGIRIRQGNILIGDKLSCSSFFKEERFNGWLIGELHVYDNELIANARRDDFEKNEAYYILSENLIEWSARKTKEIRKLSYERSLSSEKKAVVEASKLDDVNDLLDESLALIGDLGESHFIDQGESESVAETDFIGRLSFLINQKNTQTKYTALNINTKLSMEQRRVLERVFDLIVSEYEHEDAEAFINIIAKKF